MSRDMAMSLGQIRDYLMPCVREFVPGADIRIDAASDCFFLLDSEGKEHFLLARMDIERDDWRHLGPQRIRELVGIKPVDYMAATRAICGHI